MSDEEKRSPKAAEATAYYPPPRPGAAPESGEPPETVARYADSTDRQPQKAAPGPAESLETAAIAGKGGAAADGVVQATVDWTSPDKSAILSRVAAALVGRQIGEYEILGELGHGGMGVVYQARHRQLGRIVALKMIRSGAHADDVELERFLSEAQAVARLQHPGIVQIFDIGQHDGLPYFSLEFVEGQSLLARIAREPLEPRAAAELVEQLAVAMQYAHDRGILHRDLKPANILLTLDEKPKIADFGLAKQIEAGDSSATRTGAIMGTPSYMSPEQASGNNKELTAATDQYALGAVLYHLLTGRPPFLAAKPVETILQVTYDDPVAPRVLAPKLPADLETICLKALQKDPQRRYASCGELAADLRRFLSGEPIVARPVGSIERLWRWCRRHPRVAIPTAASLLFFLIAFGISVGSAWALASLNADLKKQTTIAQTQEGIAKQKAIVATVAEAEERAAREEADKWTDISLGTVARVTVMVEKRIPRDSALQQFKMDVLRSAIQDLEKMAGVTGSSGKTSAAVMLRYHRLMGQLYRDVGETEKAWSQLSKAHDIAQGRIKVQSGSTASRLNLADICRDMALIRQEYQRDMHVSATYSQQAVSLYEDVLANPKPPLIDSARLQLMLLLADAYSEVGVTNIRLGNPERAMEFFTKSEEQRVEVLKDPTYLALPVSQRNANAAGFREKSADAAMRVGDILVRTNRADEGLAQYVKATTIYEELVTKHIANPAAKSKLLAATSQTGYWRFVTGDPNAALPLYDRSLALAKELAALDAKLVSYQTTLALMHYRMGILKQSLGDPSAAGHFAECLKIRTALAKDDVNVKRKQELMLALARSGNYVQASALAGKLRTDVANPDIELLLDVARAYAQCSDAVAPDETAAAEAFRANAIYAVGQAVKAGHKDKFYLSTEPDFVPLRERDDFRALANAGSP